MQVTPPEDLARWLGEQHAARQPYQSMRERLTSVDDGYRVQQAYVDQLLQAEGLDGDGIAGYKIGLTSARMQAMCGLSEPIAGIVLASRVHRSDVTLSTSHYLHLGIESELCVSFGSDLPAQCTREYALAQLRSVHAAFELVDDRHADYGQLDAASLVADNSWNAGVVLGGTGPIDLDLSALHAHLRIDGHTVDTGTSGEALGHPLDAVLWLCQWLGTHGKRLRAGEIVMTGSIVPTRFVQPGQRCELQIDGLPPVTAIIEA